MESDDAIAIAQVRSVHESVVRQQVVAKQTLDGAILYRGIIDIERRIVRQSEHERGSGSPVVGGVKTYYAALAHEASDGSTESVVVLEVDILNRGGKAESEIGKVLQSLLQLCFA